MKALWTSIIAFGCISAATFAQETISEKDLPPPADGALSAPAPAPEAKSTAPSASASVADQPVIPVPFAATRYEKTWEKNPFLLRTVVSKAPTASWAQDWALAGMFNNEGKIRVSIVNKQTGEYKHLSNQGAPDPEFRLIEAHFNRDRTDASAEIAKGDDKETIKYDDTLTSRPITMNNTQHVAGTAPGAAGNPNAKPGAPVKPGTTPANRGGVPPAPGVNNNPAGMPVNGIGGVNGATAGGNPNINTNTSPAAPITASPTGSRRRQLIPGPIATPRQ